MPDAQQDVENARLERQNKTKGHTGSIAPAVQKADRDFALKRMLPSMKKERQ